MEHYINVCQDQWKNYPLLKPGYDLKNLALRLIQFESKNAQRAAMTGEKKNVSLRCAYKAVYVSVCVNVSVRKHLTFKR